jgi:hypothetical protein
MSGKGLPAAAPMSALSGCEVDASKSPILTPNGLPPGLSATAALPFSRAKRPMRILYVLLQDEMFTTGKYILFRAAQPKNLINVKRVVDKVRCFLATVRIRAQLQAPQFGGPVSVCGSLFS